MAECSFSETSTSACGGGISIPLNSCNKDISAHLRQYKMVGSLIGDDSLINLDMNRERNLILARAFMYDTELSIRDTFTICPNHRYSLGSGWLPPKKLCTLFHDKTRKPSKGASIAMAVSHKRLHDKDENYKPVPPGLKICVDCHGSLMNQVRSSTAIDEEG